MWNFAVHTICIIESPYHKYFYLLLKEYSWEFSRYKLSNQIRFRLIKYEMVSGRIVSEDVPHKREHIKKNHLEINEVVDYLDKIILLNIFQIPGKFQSSICSVQESPVSPSVVIISGTLRIFKLLSSSAYSGNLWVLLMELVFRHYSLGEKLKFSKLFSDEECIIIMNPKLFLTSYWLC